MPQADLNYSADLPIDPAKMLALIEEVIAAHDPTAGACKGRAHPVTTTPHTHLLLRLRMLEKPHRNDAFMNALVSALQDALRPLVPAPCIVGVEAGFLSRYYASETLQ